MVDGINAIYKRYTYKLMSNVQLPGSKRFDSQMQMHTSTQKNDFSLSKEFQEHLSKDHLKNEFIYQGKFKKYAVKENG